MSHWRAGNSAEVLAVVDLVVDVIDGCPKPDYVNDQVNDHDDGYA